MEGNYSVSFRNRQCGKVEVRRQGLYYHFSCRCQLKEDVLCRLQISCGGKQHELGVLVPINGGFGLDKKIPVKYLEDGNPEFRLYTRADTSQGRFISITPEEPFAYIAKLKNAYLVRRNGEVGVIV